MLVLGFLGSDIQAAAVPGGLTLGPASSGRLDEALSNTSDPLISAAGRQIDQLLELGLAERVDDRVSLPWASFSEAVELGFELPTRWTAPSPLLLLIERTSELGRPDFSYRYHFRLGTERVSVDRCGYVVREVVRNRLFHLDSDTFAMVEAMDRFNVLDPLERTNHEAWLSFARVKGCAASTGAQLDAYLASNDVVVPSTIGLRLYHHPERDAVSFVPSVPGVSEESLANAFLSSRDADGVYSLDAPAGNGSRIRVVFSDKQRQVLDRMRVVRRVTGERRSLAEKHPEAFFEGLADSVEFWRRVTGVGELSLPTMPKQPSSGGGFFEKPSETGLARPVMVEMPGAEAGRRPTIAFESEAAAVEAYEAVETAIAQGRPSLSLGGQLVAANEEALSALAAFRPDPPPTERGTKAGGRFLLTHSNQEELWRRAQGTLPDNRSLERGPPPFSLPASLNGTLKKHQVEGARWLQHCDSLRPDRRGVLLADDMGLGKTLQILVHLAWLIENGRQGLGAGQDDRPPWRPLLIVAPLILVENEVWTSEMEKFFANKGDLFKPILTLHGAGVDRVRRSGSAGRGAETQLGRPILDADLLMQYRTVITNYETVVNYQHSLAQMQGGRSLWSAIVTDEAQRYKSPATKISYALKALDASTYIASTGTPVENRLLDLWNVVDTLEPGHLSTATEFSRRYEKEEDASQRSATLDGLRSELKYGQPDTLLLRRTKEELLADDLPTKTIKRLVCALSPEEAQAHRELVSTLDGERRAGRHLQVLHRLQALYQHPGLVTGDLSVLSPKEICRRSGKVRTVLAELGRIREAGEKAIIFARLVASQEMLARVIGAEFGIDVSIINGASQRVSGTTGSSAGTRGAREHRRLLLDRFRSQPGFGVIVLSPFVAGIGLTITEANHVFHFGRWWNPAVEAQATDRAYRIGQTRPVSVYLPILKDESGGIASTFDEALDRLLQRKDDLARDFLQPTDIEDLAASELCADLISGGGGGVVENAPLTAVQLAGLTPFDFEAAVAALYRSRGADVILTARGNDGGADVIAVQGGVVRLVQVKHTGQGRPVDVDALDDLFGAHDNYRPRLGNPQTKLVLATNGIPTRRLRSEASSRGVELLSGLDLVKAIGAAKVGVGALTTIGSQRCATFDEGVRRARSALR